MQKKYTLEDAITIFRNRWPDVKSSSRSRPIFIFSAGWRSGSTLLQRLLLSSGEIVIWGEPYSISGLVECISDSVKCITETYPRNNWISDNWTDPLELTENFVANFYPGVDYLLQAHVEFFENLMAKSAAAKGIEKWGFKEVRLSIDHAIYLDWLFPESKFLFLYRNPYNAYKSFKGARWYRKWPDDIVQTSEQFGEHWKFLLDGYLNHYQKVDSLVIKYEDLCSKEFDFEMLSNFLELNIDSNILTKKISGKKVYRDVSPNEMYTLQKIVEPLASSLGYFYQE